MSSGAQAQSEKDKGNTFFRTGDFAKAIGHYSAAIVADRKDPTLPLNRAAAYLKLGKHEDAERDCTTSLSLRTSQVKALFRRAQARIALQKMEEARDDLNQALKLEPKNESVISELKRLEELAGAAKPSAKKPLDIQSQKQTAVSTTSPRRRRVPIEIVEGKQYPASVLPASQPSQSVAENPTPISSRVLSPSKRAEENGLPSATKPAHSSARAGGGGIFRASGESTMFSTKSSPPTPKVPPSAPRPSNTPAVVSAIGLHIQPSSSETSSPLTLFDFTSAWNRSEDVSDRWALLSSIPPSAIPSLFRTSLEAPMLVSILEVFSVLLASQRDHGDESDMIDSIKEYLRLLARVPRFSIILMFLTSSERNVAKRVCELLGGQIDGWDL